MFFAKILAIGALLLDLCREALAVTPSISKVGIVGSGPAGLGLAAALARLDSKVEEVVIFEAREDFLQASLGGGVQLTGGASVLDKLGLGEVLHQRAQPLQRVFARNAREDTLLDLDVATLIQQRASTELCRESGQPLCYSIMRDNLQELLFEASQSNSDYKGARMNTKVQVVNGKEVASVKEDEDSDIVQSIARSHSYTRSAFTLSRLSLTTFAWP